MTRLGKFWNFMATNFVSKVSQMFRDFFGQFLNYHLLSQTVVTTFGQLLENLGYFLFLHSGHTGHEPAIV